MQFLSANAFTTPGFVIKPEILRRIEPVGTLERIRTSQLRVLATLLAEPRIARLVEQEAVDGAAAYRPTEFFTDLRRAVWREIDATSVQIDPYRRNLQRAYLDAMSDKVNRVTSESTAAGARRAAGARHRRACRHCQSRRSHHAAASAGRAGSDRQDSRSEVCAGRHAAGAADHLRCGRVGRLLVRLRDSDRTMIRSGRSDRSRRSDRSTHV